MPAARGAAVRRRHRRGARGRAQQGDHPSRLEAVEHQDYRWPARSRCWTSASRRSRGMPTRNSGAPDLTLTLGGTKEGVLVGTVAYVSPEQAMGDRVDGGSDIWAFGCLLYEMLTAKRAFPGVAVADTLGAVMRGEPDWTALPADTPPALRTLLRRCLEKDRARRLADIADARLEIDDLLAGRFEYAQVTTRRRYAHGMFRRRDGAGWLLRRRLWRVSSSQASWRDIFNRHEDRCSPAPENPPPVRRTSRTADESRRRTNGRAASSHRRLPKVAARISRQTARRLPKTPVRSAVNLPAGMTWAASRAEGPNTVLAISPDGRQVVFSARLADDRALWLRSLAADDLVQLPGTEDGVSPFWSPDSSSVGFFADGRLKRLDVGAPGARPRDWLAAPVNLCEARNQRGGTWGARQHDRVCASVGRTQADFRKRWYCCGASRIRNLARAIIFVRSFSPARDTCFIASHRATAATTAIT